MSRWYKRLICWLQGHLWVRRAVDPTMRQTSRSVIVCIECGRELTENPYPA